MRDPSRHASTIESYFRLWWSFIIYSSSAPLSLSLFCEMDYPSSVVITQVIRTFYNSQSVIPSGPTLQLRPGGFRPFGPFLVCFGVWRMLKMEMWIPNAHCPPICMSDFDHYNALLCSLTVPLRFMTVPHYSMTVQSIPICPISHHQSCRSEAP